MFYSKKGPKVSDLHFRALNMALLLRFILLLRGSDILYRWKRGELMQCRNTSLRMPLLESDNQNYIQK